MNKFNLLHYHLFNDEAKTLIESMPPLVIKSVDIDGQSHQIVIFSHGYYINASGTVSQWKIVNDRLLYKHQSEEDWNDKWSSEEENIRHAIILELETRKMLEE